MRFPQSWTQNIIYYGLCSIVVNYSLGSIFPSFQIDPLFDKKGLSKTGPESYPFSGKSKNFNYKKLFLVGQFEIASQSLL